MERLIIFGLTTAVLGAMSWGLEWLFANYFEFAFGICTGMGIMTGLYYIAERTGFRPTVY